MSMFNAGGVIKLSIIYI